MKRFFCILVCLLAIVSSCSQPVATVQTVSPQEVYEAVHGKRNSSLQLVDVRTAEEYGVSHLKDAQNICVTESDFQEKVKSLDKNKPVYVYCRSGVRSAKASKMLHDMGFTQIFDLEGGIKAWEKEGLDTSN